MRLLSNAASAPAEGPITPASQAYAPFADDFLRDPFPQLAAFRAAEPVFFSPQLGSWIVTRHATIRTVLRDTAGFSAKVASDPLKPLCPMARSIIQSSDFDVPPLLVNNDPPDHTRCRRFFSEALQRPRLVALEPYVRQTVSRYLDALASRSGPVDLVKSLTWDVPALVLFRLLGVPDEDVERVKTWADSRVVLTWGLPTDEDQIRLSRGAVEYYQYARELVASKVREPKDDYLSDLVRLRNGDDSRATLHEITVGAFNLLFAGHETTSSAAVSLFKTVLPNRQLWASICAGEVPLDDVVEESLRLEPPVMAWRRLALQDTVLDGIHVPAGSRLLLYFAAGNRDQEQFPDPDAFNTERANKQQHLTFGFGSHFCMGAPLARLEVRTMLEMVAQRFPTLSLAPEQQFEYVPNTSFRALKQLMVTW